jgi:hypothetical protein
MENKPLNRPICRNLPDFNVKEWPLKAQESRIILTCAFTHPVPGKAENREYEDLFSEEESLKTGKLSPV